MPDSACKFICLYPASIDDNTIRWMQSLQLDTKYVALNGFRKGKQTFACFRSAESISNPSKIRILQGKEYQQLFPKKSCKLKTSCISRIHVSQVKNCERLKVTFISTHSGHDAGDLKELKFERLASSVKNQIMTQLFQSIPPNRIVWNMTQALQNPDLRQGLDQVFFDWLFDHILLTHFLIS